MKIIKFFILKKEIYLTGEINLKKKQHKKIIQEDGPNFLLEKKRNKIEEMEIEFDKKVDNEYNDTELMNVENLFEMNLKKAKHK